MKQKPLAAESDLHLTQVLASLPLAMAMLDRDLCYLHYNHLWLEAYELGEGDLTGKKYADTLPEISEEWHPILQSCLQGETHRAEEMPLPRPDGRLDWARWEVRPWYQGDGQIGGLLIYTSVITDLKKGQDKLREQGYLFSALMNSIPDTIYFKDTQSRFTHINPAQVRMMGQARAEDVLGKSDLDFQARHLAEEFIAEEHQLMTSGTPIIDRLEYNPTPDGTPRWLSATKVPLYDHTGDIVGMVGMSRDITERVLAQQALEKSEQAARDFQNDLKILYEVSLELGKCNSVVELCEQAVTLGHKRLGIDRLGLFLVDRHENLLKGMYGTDPQGGVRNEQHYRAPLDKNGWTEQVDEAENHIVFWEEAPLYDEDQVVGTGWKIAAGLWDGEQAVGYFVMDNFVRRHTPRHYEVELMSLFGSTIGYIVKRLLTEEALQQSEAQAKAVLEALPDMVFVVQADGTFTDYKAAQGTDLYIPKEAFIGKKVAEVLPPPLGGALQQKIEEAIQTKHLQVFEYQLSMPKGLEYYEARFVASDENLIVVIIRNITERKTSEEALRKNDELLRATQALAKVGGWEVDLVQQQAFWTAQTRVMYEVEEDYEPELDKWLEIYIPEHQPIIQKSVQTCVKTGTPFDLELQMLTAKGQRTWIRVMGQAEQQAGKTIRLYGTFQDIDARKQAEKERERLIRELKDALLFKDQFLATMSHELRTPLNAIQGYTGLILQEDELNADITHMLVRIKDNSKRLLTLINDILDISRINANRVELVLRPINLEDMVLGWYSDFKTAASDKKLDFKLDMVADLPEVILGDEERITQIIANLLQNAFKFTHEGQVILGVKPDGENWQVTIQDSGIGIPDTWQHLIFDEFRQVDSSSKRKYGGAGLGLSIVQKLCRLMNGNITVTSQLGQGSTFTVTLPVIQPVQA